MDYELDEREIYQNPLKLGRIRCESKCKRLSRSCASNRILLMCCNYVNTSETGHIDYLND